MSSRGRRNEDSTQKPKEQLCFKTKQKKRGRSEVRGRVRGECGVLQRWERGDRWTAAFPRGRWQRLPMSRKRGKEGSQVQWQVGHIACGEWRWGGCLSLRKALTWEGEQEGWPKTKTWGKVMGRVKGPQPFFLPKFWAGYNSRKTRKTLKNWKYRFQRETGWGRRGEGQKTIDMIVQTKQLLFYNYVWNLWEKRIWRILYKMLKVIFFSERKN